MEFGKADLLGLDQIDLSLPPDDPRTWVMLKRRGERHSSARTAISLARIGIGTPVWGVKDWAGKVYPVGTQPKDFLFHYSRQFNSIELNSTHYSVPDAATIGRWRDTTPNGFKFNPKMLQDVTHRGPLNSNAGLVREFLASVMGLEDRLGFVFVQLPPSFAPHQLGELRWLLGQMPKEVSVAVEVRHPDFFRHHCLATPLFDLLCEHDASAVITDVTGRRDVLHTSLPMNRVMVRFLGNDLHPTDETRISDWVSRIHTWLNLGLEQIEFFVHQPEDKNAPELIARMIDRFNSEYGMGLSKWRPALTGTQLGLQL